ncbi:N2227-like domain-containing protein [Tieghemostelium lacteum]|uniref:carnosine N-methyltransferase n=1 Tax=Tieghemostelium lacteum TaxID=361077 RepID=A0A151ZF91_TIELA|nr:N2227-like domain-containing protein [Tieghemostelium lacteum]|eukprot:KYQ92636.1 N2227-like domain-containing protein [Tieghemostelium lacteum]
MSHSHDHSQSHSHSHSHNHSHNQEINYNDDYYSDDEDDNEAELQHYKLIVSTLYNYQKYGYKWVDDMESFYHNTLTDQQRLLIPNYISKTKALRVAVLKNSIFLRMIGDEFNNVFHEGEQSLKPIPHLTETQATIESMDIDLFQIDNLKSSLKQFVREWSLEGKAERDQAFQPIKNELESLFANLSIFDRANIKIYCPGSGLGRLPLEIASMGFSCQGIEFSYLMLICSSFMLNKTQKTNEFTIYPYIHQTVNVLKDIEQLKNITIPDILPGDILPKVNPKQEFSMAAGDFTKNIDMDHWDVICTCFFIDTARNILEYLECIHKILKKGGHWINFGPLLYHFAEKKDSIELSYEQLRHAITTIGFTIIKEELKDSDYCSNRSSLLKSTYKCQFFVAIKN